MQGLRKNNHYVPKLYLKQWARNNEIQTYRLLVPHENLPPWKLHSLSSIAFHEHLYTRVAGGKLTDEFERWLHTDFENPADGAICRVVREERLTPDDWNALIRFAMAQDVRTPAHLKAFLAQQHETLPALMKEILEESVGVFESGAAANKTFKKLPDELNPLPLKVSIQRNLNGDGAIKAEIVVGRAFWLSSMRRILTSTIQKIPKTGWTILHAPEGVAWPTSDNPLVRLNFTDASQYDFLGGWGVRNGDIFMPLSPKHLMHTCIGKRPERRGTVLDLCTAQLIHKIIVEHADRYVFSREPFDVQLIRPRFVSKEAYMQEKGVWEKWEKEQHQVEINWEVQPLSPEHAPT
jgi:hypothetical protein